MSEINNLEYLARVLLSILCGAGIRMSLSSVGEALLTAIGALVGAEVGKVGALVGAEVGKVGAAVGADEGDGVGI